MLGDSTNRSLRQLRRSPAVTPASFPGHVPAHFHANGRRWLPWASGLGRSELPIRNSSIRVRGLAAFGDGPDDQALAAGHVAGGEDLGNIVRLSCVGLDVPTLSSSTPSCSSMPLSSRGRRSPSPAGRARPDKPARSRGSRRIRAGRCSSSARPGPSRARRRRPFSPWNRLVMIEYSRSPPSSWADETRKMFDHCGQGLFGARSSGGRGTISN